MEDEMSESIESELSELDKNAQVFKQLQGQDEIDEEAEIDAALNTIKSGQLPVQEASTTDAAKQEAVLT
jgi:hypothetical protein